MKKIYNLLLAAVAGLAFAPGVIAQTDYSIAGQIQPTPYFKEAGNVYDVQKNVGYRKSVSSPLADGTYWIKLETFATGEATEIVSNSPADIVLVLDFSGSMATNYTTALTYVPVIASTINSRYTAFTYQLINNNTLYVEYNGEYCEVQTDRTEASFNAGGYGWAYFQTTDGTTYYLDGDTITTTQPVWSGTGNFGNNTVLWTESLLRRYNNQNVTRINALKAAVADFIDVIYHNDNYEGEGTDNPRSTPLGNRISLVVYSSDNETASRQLAGWTNVTSASGARDESLLTLIAAQGTSQGTYSNRGMTLANTLLSEISEDRKAEASRTVVLFTDGLPGNDRNWVDESTRVANLCIAQANTAKNTHGATVFTVAIYNGIESETNMYNYMNYTSSNYPYATSLDTPGVLSNDESIPADQRKDPTFFKDAGDDLSGVFKDIAKQSGGSSDTSLSSSTSTVDVVSHSFKLPTGANENSIKVFTAKCLSADYTKNAASGTFTFDTEILIDHSPDMYNTYDSNGNVTGTFDVDAAIAPHLSTDAQGNPMITVTGFDYSNNWCGKKTSTTGQVTYQGHKLIILIPIQMNEDAVGGPNQPTNAEGSGIYVNGDDTEPLFPLTSPTLSLPVNIHITKDGLRPGESAKFKISRTKLPMTDSSVWEYVSSVFVTNGDNAMHMEIDGVSYPVVYVRGLPATVEETTIVDGETVTTQVGLVYKVEEEPWAWSYEQTTPPQYTNTENIDNPFTFKNTKKDGIDYKVRHAESKAINTFKPTSEGGGFKWEDSKTNTKRTETEGEGEQQE